MKFAKDLESELVPEWRAKYLDYKTGKKKVKAVARALKNVHQTPRTPRTTSRKLLQTQNSFNGSTSHTSHETSHLSNLLRSPFSNLSSRSKTNDATGRGGSGGSNKPLVQLSDEAQGEDQPSTQTAEPAQPGPIAIPEAQPLRGDAVIGSYGSIVATPPAASDRHTLSSLRLPDPALDPDQVNREGGSDLRRHATRETNFIQRTPSVGPDPYHVGQTTTPKSAAFDFATRPGSLGRLQQKRRTFSSPIIKQDSERQLQPPLLKRMFTNTSLEQRQTNVPLEAYRDYDHKNDEFFAFLDSELEKIEDFYKMKEEEATARLAQLRDQLHMMRDRRLDEIAASRRNQQREDGDSTLTQGLLQPNWLKPIDRVIPGKVHYGKTTKSLQRLGPREDAPPSFPGALDGNSDFVRKVVKPEKVPYQSAKRKLKLALLEYYRGLELLKSYALMNRTAFRKINKKYDKAVNARPTQRYMSEKVNKAYFVTSEIVEHHIVTIEDIYARYFERGNRKIAVSKLRGKGMRHEDHSVSGFINGLFIAGGLVFGAQGVARGFETLNVSDPDVVSKTSYLLQIYGGFFLIAFHFLLFCLDCAVWNQAKINYVFVFEYDTRFVLDWRELSQIPSFFLALMGLFIWVNFSSFGHGAMYIYWPVILIGVTVLILFFPAPVLYHRSRKWWLYSNWRLLLAGLYPVEFRDFFLGDMYCSQTYAMGNIALFFCLYARHWNDPSQCNSSHSRLLGFFSTLPGIWRALQCIRRYYDTRNIFPHLVNCGKYSMTILYYVTLSLYRINKTNELRAIFILFATLNSIYCSIWDLAMDWSLLNPYAKKPFLRDTLGLQHTWVYYAAMPVDIVLRFNWIFYAIFAHDVQHSAVLSFFVAFSEVLRRGIWSIFRVENEHCTNVGRFRASRDVPLPYSVANSPPSTPVSDKDKTDESDETVTGAATASGVSPRPGRATPAAGRTFPRTPDLEAGRETSGLTQAGDSSATVRRRRRSMFNPDGADAHGDTIISRGIARVGTMITLAHAEDFERKKKPEDDAANGPGSGRGPAGMTSARHYSSDDDEDEDDDSDGGNSGDGLAADDVPDEFENGNSEDED